MIDVVAMGLHVKAAAAVRLPRRPDPWATVDEGVETEVVGSALAAVVAAEAAAVFYGKIFFQVKTDGACLEKSPARAFCLIH